MSAVYRTLMEMIQQADSMGAASVGFGEENINAQDTALPYCCIVPVGGPWTAPGYYKDVDVDLNMLWMTGEMVDLYLSAAAPDPDAQPVDHADATIAFTTLVLRALQQQAPNGLLYVPQSGRWVPVGNASVRYGRSYVLTVRVDITVTDFLPVDVTVLETTLDPITLES